MDKRLVHLRVKIKSLETEAKIIRLEEQRALKHDRFKHGSDWNGYSDTYQSLKGHRKDVVGRESRHSLLAYGFLRGLPYKAIEPKCRPDNAPSFSKVKELSERFYHIRLRRDSMTMAQSDECRKFDNMWKAWLEEAKK